LEVQNINPSFEATNSEEFKVLFIDDCPQLRLVLNEVLNAEGYDVKVASNAGEALDTLERFTPDAIISDIMMPQADGYSLQRVISEDARWCHIPFIFLSALSSPEDVRAGKAVGCDDYLTKPFNTEDLVSTINGKILASRLRKKKSDEDFSKYRKRVVHTLSHEFRTPLVAINTGAELLLDRANESDEQTFNRLLESVHRGGLRLQRLVEDFMFLQQIETGSAKKVAERLKRRVKLQQLVTESLEHYHDVTRDKSLLVECRDETSEIIWVEVYDAQIHNIVSRLLSNAHKFAGTAIPAVLIIRNTPESGSIIIKDSGPGLPEGLVNSACEIFTQIDREHMEQQGCGLGLTIANHYAVYNGGKLLFLTPTTEAGLEVELKLPRVK